jgi:hypothetical protein
MKKPVPRIGGSFGFLLSGRKENFGINATIDFFISGYTFTRFIILSGVIIWFLESLFNLAFKGCLGKKKKIKFLNLL